jgi:hypothetical protein
MPRPLAIRPDSLDIVAPLISPKKAIRSPIRVTIDSPKQYRRAVFRIACFFRRELGYDFVQYGDDGNEEDWNHVAFLWVHPEAVGGATSLRVPCIGAAVFRQRSARNPLPPVYALQWIWVHPYWRRKGLLSGHWGALRQEFGNFQCEPPLSPAMQQFLESRSEDLVTD